jgi:hypothetical protein
MQQAKLILKPEIFLRHTADLCFIGQDVFEMRPGELWLVTHYGRTLGRPAAANGES